MTLSARFIDLHLAAYSKNWDKFLMWGIVLMLIGVLAVTATAMTTLVSIMVLGFLLLFSGCVILLDTFTFWHGKDHGFVTHLLAAVLYIAGGTILLTNPVEGSVTITLLLGMIYTLLGLTRLFFATAIRLPSWGWTFSNGLITLLIGILIISSWPQSSLYIIGLFVGIDIFFCGLAYTMAAFALKNKSRR
jgi:uncharacterized membrane protein HdeD (DUF308 family)